MSLILRIDVDKPYGRENMLRKVLSRLREDFWFPAMTVFGYLYHLEKLLCFLSESHIKAHIYFRKCTLPPRSWLAGSILNGHKIGLHVENTRSFEYFKKELDEVQKYFNSEKITSFTKHGSGDWKGGRSHYPQYEPDKYLKWADIVDVPFLFGNHEDMYESSVLQGSHQFYPGAFWIERQYLSDEKSLMQHIIDSAKKKNRVIMMHTGCFEVDQRIEKAMRLLIKLSREQNVNWITVK